MSKFVANERGFAQLTLPDGLVDRAVQKAAGTTRDRAKRNITVAGLVDKGGLRQSVESQRLASTATTSTWRIGSRKFYAWWTEKGNGPGLIYPRSAKALRFKPKQSKTFIFAKYVKPYPGSPWLRTALRQLRNSDFR